MCMGSDKMESVMDTTTRTSDLTTFKFHMNGVVSTPGAKFAGADVKYFNLNIPLETIKKHNLKQYIEEDRWIHFKIGKGMYGIPEAGRLANDWLRERLKNT